MVAFPTYELGTVSVSNGSTTVSGDGVIWSGVNARAGDSIYIDGVQNQIVDVTDDTHLELVLPATADKTNVQYVIVWDSPLRFTGAQPMVDVSRLISTLNTNGLLWYLPAGYSQPSDVTPALTADDGQAILKIDTGALWVMQGGAWVSAGTFKGFNYKGAYSGGTAYVVNDILTDGGTAYIVTAPTTGNAPPNASYYDVFASKGDTGATGATGADATIAVGTVTSVAYGQPATVTNVGTPGAAVFDFEIPKGQDGSGTGDVVGPSGATDLAVAGFDGTTGKLIKELTATQVRAAAGASTVGAALLAAVDAAAAQDAAGASAIGKALFTAADAAAARAAIGADTLATPRYIGFYNGQGPNTTPASTYNFGLAMGASPLAMGRVGVLAPVWDHATTYKDTGGRLCPCPVLVGDRIYVYYEGYDGTRKSIFLEIYSTEGGLIEKPLEPVLLYSNVSGATSVQRPAVLYEPSDASAPFKMMFSRATSGTNCTTIYAATSLDGVNWTVLGQALAVSSGWESTYLETSGRFLKDGSTYRLFYSGYNGTSWQSGELYNTGTFGTSGWTKNASNPLLSSRGGYDVALTADTTAGTKTVKVANSALFDVGAPIAVYSSGSFQLNRIAAIPDGTTLTTLYTWQGTYTTASSSKVSQIHGRSVELCEVWHEDSTWKAIITCFQFINGQLAETTGYAETSSLSTPFTISPAEWPLALNSKIKDFDQVSAENLKFVRVQ